MIHKALSFFFGLLSFGLLAQSQDSLIRFEIRFDLDQSLLSSRAQQQVDSILSEVPVNAINSLTLYGHTDSLAEDDYNIELSKKRVQSVLRYFVRRGLDPLLVRTDYFGESRPAYSAEEAEFYKNRRVEVSFSFDKNLLPTAALKLSDLSLEKGDRVRLSNLNFIPNQAVPVWQSFDEFRELLWVMQRNPDLEIALLGHVCCSNDFELSVARARMVYDFLIENGISKIRLDYQGFGNKAPLFEETDAEKEAMNRRVEMEVLFNTKARKEVEAPKKFKLIAPVMNLKFIENSARLTPSGDFMLSLIAEDLKASEGLFYEFTLYDNIGDPSLSKQRSNMVNRVLRKKGVPIKIFKVDLKPKAPGQAQIPDYNWTEVLITER